MTAWDRRELHIANERLRDLQDERARLLRNAEITRAVAWAAVVAIAIVLIINYFGADIARVVSGVLP